MKIKKLKKRKKYYSEKTKKLNKTIMAYECQI